MKFCAPALAGARARFHAGAHAEKIDRDLELAQRALALGRTPPHVAPWRGLEIATLGRQPFASLQFIREARAAWLDTVAAPAEGVAAAPTVKLRTLGGRRF